MSLSPLEQIATEENATFSVQTDNVYSEGGSLYFVADALTEAFVPVDIMQKYAWTGKGKEARWRHEVPEKDINVLIGHIHECWFENNKIKIFVEIWGYKDDLKAIQEQIANGTFSISLGFKKSHDDNGNLIAIYIREVSITPTPQCTSELGCGISTIIQLEERETMDKETLALLEKTIISENTTLKKSAKIQDENILTLETTVKAMEDTIQNTNKVVAEQNEELEKLKAENAELQKKADSAETFSIREEIVGLENIADEKAKEAELEELAQYELPELKKMRDRIKRAIEIAQKSSKKPPVLGEEVEQYEDGIDLEEKTKHMTPEEFAANMNPELSEYMSKLSKNPAAPKGFGVKATDDVPMID